MSYYTLFGAIAVPASAREPFTYSDPSAQQIRGSSRSGAFHLACARLLNQFPGHDSLRWLSTDQVATRTPGSDGHATSKLLDRKAIETMLIELEALVQLLPSSIALLSSEVLPYHGSLSESEVSAALEGAIECQELNNEPANGEDGDSAEFFFSALVSLRALLRDALAKSQNVVIYSWLPTQSAA